MNKKPESKCGWNNRKLIPYNDVSFNMGRNQGLIEMDTYHEADKKENYVRKEEHIAEIEKIEGMKLIALLKENSTVNWIKKEEVVWILEEAIAKANSIEENFKRGDCISILNQAIQDLKEKKGL